MCASLKVLSSWYLYMTAVCLCAFQADQRFVWNGNLLRELAGQPEVTLLSLLLFIPSPCLFLTSCVVHHSSTGLPYLSSMDVSFFLASCLSFEPTALTLKPTWDPTVSKLFFDPDGAVIILKPCRINGKIFEWILISRRSCFRAGVRYYVRGKCVILSLFCCSTPRWLGSLCLQASTPRATQLTLWKLSRSCCTRELKLRLCRSGPFWVCYGFWTIFVVLFEAEITELL